MKRLFLVRHAKAMPAPAGMEDFDRPLLPLGAGHAAVMGNHMRGQGLVPDAALISDSVRTAQTARILLAAMDLPLMPVARHDLYLADWRVMLAAIRGAPAHAGALLLVGHNPGTDELYHRISDPAVRPPSDGFPTGALAVMAFDVRNWAGIAPGAGTTLAFADPRRLT